MRHHPCYQMLRTDLPCARPCSKKLTHVLNMYTHTVSLNICTVDTLNCPLLQIKKQMGGGRWGWVFA